MNQDDVKISDLLRKLGGWASEKCHELCGYEDGRSCCRHKRAVFAIVEISNAVAACQEDQASKLFVQAPKV